MVCCFLHLDHVPESFLLPFLQRVCAHMVHTNTIGYSVGQNLPVRVYVRKLTCSGNYRTICRVCQCMYQIGRHIFMLAPHDIEPWAFLSGHRSINSAAEQLFQTISWPNHKRSPIQSDVALYIFYTSAGSADPWVGNENSSVDESHSTDVFRHLHGSRGSRNRF